MKGFFQTIPTNVTVTEFVSMTTFKMQPWAFLVPVNRFSLDTFKKYFSINCFELFLSNML